MVNEHIIALQGRATLSEQLEIGHDYQVMIEVNCNKIEKVDLANGSYNFVYKVKPCGTIGILDDKGLKTAKTKTSYSQQWRIEVEKEEDYDQFMVKMLHHPKAIIDYVRSLD